MEDIGDRGIATAILVWSPEGVSLVFDETKPDPVRWKLPGGTIKPCDRKKPNGSDITDDERELLVCHGVDSDMFSCAIACAARELEEETHIKLSHEKLYLLAVEDRVSHMFFLFGTRIENPYDYGFNPEKRGNEGERVGLFDQSNPRENLETMGDFFDPHRKILMREKTRIRLRRMLGV